jgi:microcystin-dependent protein
MDPYLAQIVMFAGNFAPRGWAFCNGQLLSIAQNTALFSLLGTTYGGDGRTTFALPNLQSRVPVHPGQGPGLASIVLGEVFGSPTATVTNNSLPSHVHTLSGATVTGAVSGTLKAYAGMGNARASSGNLLAGDSSADQMYQSGSTPTGSLQANSFVGAFSNGAMAAGANSGTTGGGQPVGLQPPSLGINFIIALQGVFPSRD